MKEKLPFGAMLRAVRDTAPLVHTITNFVTVNDCANIILAAGGAPTMAHDAREAAEITEGCRSLVLNLGTVGSLDAMLAAGRRANDLEHPVVLDPVAAGASGFRRRVSARLLDELHFAVIRGNATEVKYLARGGVAAARGVDAAQCDLATEASLSAMADMARGLAARTGAVVVISGPIDVVADAGRAGFIRNGCATMSRITGSGCMLTALIGAFCGANPDHPFVAAAAAVGAIGLCGELAETRRLKNGTGTATFRADLIDAVSNLTPEQLEGGIRFELE